MRLLLDTHVWLWWVIDAPVSAQADEVLRRPDTDAHVSAASVWEVSINAAIGKLRVPDGFGTDLEADQLRPLPISVEHALRAGGLPRHHTDPFDRMLVAQAQLEDLTIVTRDERFHAYDVPILTA